MYSVAPLIPIYGLSISEIKILLKQLPISFEIPPFVYNDQDEDVIAYLKSLENRKEVVLVHIPFQVGKAEAIRQGLNSLLTFSNAQVVAQIDGRSKQPANQVKLLVKKLIETDSHMVVGNRYGLQNLEGQKHRVAGTRLFAILIRNFTGYQLQDTVCGTRVYVRDLAQQFCHLRGFGYGLEIEELIKASFMSFKVLDLPLQSNLQSDATNAEKIEDNFSVLLSYSDELDMSNSERAILSYALAQLKKRKSFQFPLSVFQSDSIVFFKYNGTGNIINGYSSQILRDSYSLSMSD